MTVIDWIALHFICAAYISVHSRSVNFINKRISYRPIQYMQCCDISEKTRSFVPLSPCIWTGPSLIAGAQNQCTLYTYEFILLLASACHRATVIIIWCRYFFNQRKAKSCTVYMHNALNVCVCRSVGHRRWDRLPRWTDWCLHSVSPRVLSDSVHHNLVTLIHIS